MDAATFERLHEAARASMSTEEWARLHPAVRESIIALPTTAEEVSAVFSGREKAFVRELVEALAS